MCSAHHIWKGVLVARQSPPIVLDLIAVDLALDDGASDVQACCLHVSLKYTRVVHRVKSLGTAPVRRKSTSA